MEFFVKKKGEKWHIYHGWKWLHFRVSNLGACRSDEGWDTEEAANERANQMNSMMEITKRD